MVEADVETDKNNVWIPWSRGEWSGDLLGFRTPQERRDFVDGRPGPFWRQVRREKPARIQLSDLAGKESHRS